MTVSKNNKKQISFEFFPNKTEKGALKLEQTVLRLAECKPAFFSVTYGAGGSTRDRTRDSVFTIKERTGIATAPHLSCIGDSKSELRALLQDYQSQDINRIVALRGDLPPGLECGSSELQYANELVEFIRQETGDYFHIEVAAYPEVHPQAADMEEDLRNFQRKVNAGANAAITQYFFNADSYFYFIERIEKMGITLPVTPGIMPVTNFSKLAHFSDACGAEIPRWIRRQLESYGDDHVSINQFGEEMVTRMCEKLLAGGAPGLHFYTLNMANPSLSICKHIGLTV